jgi:hypothetical protein
MNEEDKELYSQEEILADAQALKQKILLLKAEIERGEVAAERQGIEQMHRVIELVGLVEPHWLRMPSKEKGRGKLTKESYIKRVTGYSKTYYARLLLIYDHREYLLDEQTEAPTGIRHAVRLIQNKLSAEKREDNMATSSKTKATMTEYVEQLKLQIIEKDEIIQQQNEIIEAQALKIAELEKKLDIYDQRFETMEANMLAMLDRIDELEKENKELRIKLYAKNNPVKDDDDWGCPLEDKQE